METSTRNELNADQGKKYWAFISYSSRDAKRWAIPLRKRLESYRVPISLVGKSVRGETIPARLRPIFRDREELAAGPSLSQRILDALQASRYLIVVCSPHSKASAFVAKEIQWFKQNGGADRIFPYIVEGEPPDCFPDSLRYELDENGALSSNPCPEPLAADARPGHDGKDAPLKILAGIFQVSFDELKRRELLRRQRLLLAMSAFGLMIVLALAALTAWAVVERNRAAKQTAVARTNERTANQQKERADAERELAESRRYINDIQRIQTEWDSGDPAIALDKLMAAPFRRRGWEHHYLNTMAQRGQVTLRGHTYHVSHVSFSPDGTRVLSASQDNSLKVWDATSGRERFTLKIKGFLLKLATFSPDGKRILSLDSDGKLKLWDAEDAREIRSSWDRDLPITDASFSPDGKRVLLLARDVTLSRDSFLTIWDAFDGKDLRAIKRGDRLIAKASFSPDGKRIHILDRGALLRIVDAATGNIVRSVNGSEGKNDKSHPTTDPAVDPKTGMTFEELRRSARSPQNRGFADDNCVFSPDSKRAVTKTGSLDPAGRYQILNLETGSVIGDFAGHGIGTSLRFSPDGTLLLSAGDDNLLKVWDANSAQLIHTLTGHRGWVRSEAFSPDGLRIASASFDKTLKIWDVTTGREITSLKGHGDRVTDVAFSSDGRRLVSASDDRTLKIWDLSDLPGSPQFVGHSHRVPGVAFSPDGRFVASASWDETLKVWETESRRQIHSINAHNRQHVTSISFSPDSERLVSGGWDNSAKIWEVSNGKGIHTLTGHTGHVESVAYSPDGRRIATAGADNKLMIWDADSGKELHTLKGHMSQITRVVFSPDGKQLASSSGDHTVKLWDTDRGDELLTILAHDGWASSVSFSPDGKQVVSTGGNDGTLKLWDAPTGKPLRVFEEHNGSVTDAIFTRDSERIVSVGWDKDLKLWDVKSGQEILTLRGHSEPVERIASSRDGRRLVTGSVDKTVILWDASLALDTSSNADDLKSHMASRETGVGEGYSLEVGGDETILVNDSLRQARIARDGERLAMWAKPDNVWHKNQADDATSKGWWMAAVFHLRRLTQIEPNNPEWKKRLQSALAKCRENGK